MNKNMDVTKYEVRFLESGSLEVILNNPSWTALDNGYNTSVIISKNEVPTFLDCLKGTSTFYPVFPDISYLLRAHTDGFHFIRLSSSYDGKGSYKEAHFKVPNELLTDLHTAIQNHVNGENPDTWSLSQERIQDLSKQVKPVIKWDIHHRTEGKWEDFKYNDWIVRDLNYSLAYWSEKSPSLVDMIERLHRIALSYSVNGHPVIVSLSFDDYQTGYDHPDSFYFVLTTHDNKRIFDGGIIYHQSGNEYSMHT